MQITIAPASTKTGAAVIRSLLSFENESLKVKALYRNVSKVPDEFKSHANFTAVQADISDASSLDFAGSDAILAITPPAFDGRDIVAHSNLVSKNVRDAVEKSDTVKRLVLLSSMGAEFSEGVGELKTNNTAEQVFKSTNVPEIIFVRCAYFMENWTMSLETLKSEDPFIFSTITPLDFKVAMVAVKDIGHTLATELIKDSAPPTKPYIFELHGPQPYTPLDVRHAFSGTLGERVTIKAIEKKDLASFYAQVFPPQIIDEWIKMTTSFLPGGIAEKDASKPSEVDVVRGKTGLEEAIEAATAELR
ncbi:nucleoside-diphosphate-sugar epimerase [Fusarium albosuccineum]|uniref:Nucleoside-diphosphate-sugar epimerase n=1 Tax=Fusarium albosuccineum TaxID=1237068 RepID=A0A8H4KS16_9HYPO|nr:nucleoside-diphosphate-sugar epimerase [Fusarium albosuccineum]